MVRSTSGLSVYSCIILRTSKYYLLKERVRSVNTPPLFYLFFTPLPSQDEWQQRLVSAYGSSSRCSFSNSNRNNIRNSTSTSTTSNSNSNSYERHTRKRRTRTPAAAAAAAAPAMTGVNADHLGGHDDSDGGASECIAAVQELCSALGVPSVEAVASSGPAMAMLEAWGRQFAEAFGPAQPGAGVCGIGSEVS